MVKKPGWWCLTTTLALFTVLITEGFNLKDRVVSPARVVTVPYPPGQMLALDPMDWSANILVDQGTIFEGLYGYNRTNQVVPKVALQSVPSDGGRVWTIDLRRNARWSNGKPVTAYDFYYAWMRILNPRDSQGAIFAGITNDIENGYAYHAGAVSANAVGLKVLGPYRLRVTLNHKTNIAGLLVQSASMPVYPPGVKAHPSNWYDPRYFVGDGPYVVHSFVPNGKIVLTRNREYVGHSGEFNVGNVSQIDLIPEPAVATQSYLANHLDVAGIDSGATYHYAMTHVPGQVHRSPEAAIWYLGYDHSVMPSALENLQVRQAIALAMNRKPIVSPVMNNLVGQTAVFSYPGFPTASLETNPYPYNVALARTLLTRAGYSGGHSLPKIVLYTDSSALGTAQDSTVLTAEAVAQQLHRALNVRVGIVSVNAAVYSQMEYGGIEPGILPGYTLDEAVANWNQESNWPLGSDQWVSLALSGTIGSSAFQHHAELWNFYAYDPHDVTLWGNPTSPAEGLRYRQWRPLIAAAEKDIAYLTAWVSRQPVAYREALDPSGKVSLSGSLKRFEQAYAKMKTAQEKHEAWVRLWKWVGTYKGQASDRPELGLNAEVYVDQNEPRLEYEVRMWTAELNNTDQWANAARLSARIAQAMVDSGYAIPLYYDEAVYLQKPNLRGVQANPWAELGFYQFQYLQISSEKRSR